MHSHKYMEHSLPVHSDSVNDSPTFMKQLWPFIWLLPQTKYRGILITYGNQELTNWGNKNSSSHDFFTIVLILTPCSAFLKCFCHLLLPFDYLTRSTKAEVALCCERSEGREYLKASQRVSFLKNIIKINTIIWIIYQSADNLVPYIKSNNTYMYNFPFCPLQCKADKKQTWAPNQTLSTNTTYTEN